MGTFWPHGPEASVSLMIMHTFHMNSVEGAELDAVLRSFWELESLGIHGPDDLTYDHFVNNVLNDRYEVA